MRRAESPGPYSIPRSSWLVLLLSLASVTVHAQVSKTRDPGFTFEVASVRPSDSSGFVHFVRMDFQQDEYRATNTTLQLLLQDAYGVDARQIIGAPAWAESLSLDIDARIDNVTYEALQHLTGDQLKAAQKHMLKSLLAERFALTLHNETKELPIYSLVIAKHGTRLQPAKPGDTYAGGERWPGGESMGSHTVSYSRYGGKVEMKGQGASLALLVDRLTQKLADRLGRKIVDNTGVTGQYDFELNFTIPWSNNATENSLLQADGSAEASENDNTTASEQSLFTALQEQLGLKLQSTIGLVETIVIDHVERPSAN